MLHSVTEPQSAVSILDQYIREAEELLLRSGYTATQNHDMPRWADIVANAPRSSGVNPTFNPAVSGPFRAAHWIELRSGGELAAVAAMRLFECPDGYYELVRQGLLWSRPPGRKTPIIIDRHGIGGAIAHSGGLYVRPEYRGDGLSWIVTRLNQAWAMRDWALNAIYGLMFSGIHDAGLTANYGAQSCPVMLEGEFWVTGTEVRIYSAEYPLPHLVARLVRDLGLLRHNRHKQVRDLAPLVAKRDNKAAV